MEALILYFRSSLDAKRQHLALSLPFFVSSLILTKEDLTDPCRQQGNMDALCITASTVSTTASVTCMLLRTYGLEGTRDQIRAAFYSIYAVALWMSYPSSTILWMGAGFQIHDILYSIMQWRSGDSFMKLFHGQDQFLVRICEAILLSGAYGTAAVYVTVPSAVYATAVIMDIAPAVSAMASDAIHPFVLISTVGGFMLCVAFVSQPLTVWHCLFLYFCGALSLVRLPSLSDKN